MADLEFERKESLSREQAAAWLAELSQAFARGGNVTLPLGPGSVGFHLPDDVQAELEIEVDGEEMQVEIEFSWSRRPAG